MITINKELVGEWMLFSYLAEQKLYKEKIKLFEKKYNTDFNQFENQIKNADKENFEQWDDYIGWKAYLGLFMNVSKMIDDVRHGNFKVA